MHDRIRKRTKDLTLCAMLCALGVVLAALATRFRWVGELLYPIVAAIKAVPVVSFIILALVWLQSEQLPLFISALMVFPPVYLNVLEGIRQTDRKLIEMAKEQLEGMTLSEEMRNKYGIT